MAFTAGHHERFCRELSRRIRIKHGVDRATRVVNDLNSFRSDEHFERGGNRPANEHMRPDLCERPGLLNQGRLAQAGFGPLSFLSMPILDDEQTLRSIE